MGTLARNGLSELINLTTLEQETLNVLLISRGIEVNQFAENSLYIRSEF